jgi:glycosyltransferase involved in cell wall biosynthesis
VLHHEENALLVPPDDVEAAAAAIRLAVSHQPATEKLGYEARQNAAYFTWQARAERLAAFLENVCP